MEFVKEIEVSGQVCTFVEKRIGILGGTFNPPHNGHLFLAEQAKIEFSLEKVLVIPSGEPPHKLHTADKEIRRHMAGLFVQERPYLELCEIELNRKGLTYTIDTIRQLHSEMREVSLYYIIGADTLFDLENWREHEELFGLVEFICFGRMGTPNIQEQIEYLKRKYGKDILCSKSIGPNISSTGIRTLLKEGKSVAELVPLSILEFLESENGFRK